MPRTLIGYARPELDQALAAVRRGDTLVVPKLDRLARSVPDARAITDELVERGVTLALGQSRYNPADQSRGRPSTERSLASLDLATNEG